MNVRATSWLWLSLLATSASTSPAIAQEISRETVFRSSVDLVSVAAVVRDRRGKVVSSLTRDDFEVTDAGHPRPIIDLQTEAAAPATLALLVDGSGSMQLDGALERSQQISAALLASLDATRDDAALFAFDTRLLTICDFTSDFAEVRDRLAQVRGWGSTSLYDAIAGSAGIVAQRSRNRRAVIVLTDGADNASAYSPEEVSAIASTIDVPVYVFALGSASVPSPGSSKPGTRRAAGPLAELAWATGGDYIAAGTQELVAAGVRRLIEELRHQYLIAFESASTGGLRHVQVRTRRGDLKVRTRSHYYAGSGD